MFDFLDTWSANGVLDLLTGLGILVAWIAVYAVPSWRFFSRAGVSGWPSIVPFFRQNVELKMAGLNNAWVIAYIAAAVLWAWDRLLPSWVLGTTDAGEPGAGDRRARRFIDPHR